MTEPINKIRESDQLYSRRVYPLDELGLTEEQIAVAFAMTSRRPEAFDEIAKQVSEEKAADFNERWVLGYGHASVAEHAVVHLAVENVSRSTNLAASRWHLSLAPSTLQTLRTTAS